MSVLSDMHVERVARRERLGIPNPDKATVSIEEYNKIVSRLMELEGELAALKNKKRKHVVDYESCGCITVKDVQIAVANYFNIDVSEILSQRQDAGVSFPRKAAYYLAKQLTNLSWSQIGRRFERDHSTVMSGYRWVDAKCRECLETKADIEALRQEIISAA